MRTPQFFQIYCKARLLVEIMSFGGPITEKDITYSTRLMRPAVLRWINHGITDFIADSVGDVSPLTFDGQHKEFLPRLKTYLEKQFDFDIRLDTNDEVLCSR